jgi:hypothetical protein
MSLDVNTSGNINLQTTVREIEERLHRVEKEVFKIADGSGTGRYVDNWTQESDGKDYPPSSYGTGNEPAPDVLTVGSSFRILRADQSVDPVVHVATALSDGLVTYESDGETLEVSRDHVVTVKA